MNLPLYQEISYCDPLEIISAFSDKEGTLFLDSSMRFPSCGHYSFIAIYPFGFLTSKNGEIHLNGELFFENPFVFLRTQLSRFQMDNHPELPPFQGGIAGYFAYELYRHLETVASSQRDDMLFPDLMLGFYDLVIAFDHLLKKAWITSTGHSFENIGDRIEYAKNRLQQVTQEIEKKQKVTSLSFPPTEIHFDFNKNKYCEAVEKVRKYILAGDIFEANISQRFTGKLPSNRTGFDLYCALRHINPAPFAGYFKMRDIIIASASPERFLKLQQGLVETRPIKGTRRRGQSHTEDVQLANELLISEKDRAENVMIVDLLRNDLSRVCEDHSVQVPKLCSLESYPAVHHLVSVVIGKLKKNQDAIDLLKAAFPGGSITGAPKIRAMEIIAEIEPTQRGPYCGSMGYIGFNGDMDTSILIRTFAIKKNQITFQAGSAIVLDSEPEAEYAETITKAKALMRALGSINKNLKEDYLIGSYR